MRVQVPGFLVVACSAVFALAWVACRRASNDVSASAISCQFGREECLEYGDSQRASDLRGICAANGGTYRSSGCPLEHASGRCTVDFPSSIRVYYGISHEVGEKTCVAARGGTYTRVR